jgi:cytosine/adenosine deaminase-related metal-dependent hydrolase
VDALLDEGVSVAIGTDSPASVPDLSLWAEMATLSANFPAVPAARWLEAGTRGGARALGLRGFGVLATGARPGVLDVLVEDVKAPIESLVHNPLPDLRWVARA